MDKANIDISRLSVPVHVHQGFLGQAEEAEFAVPAERARRAPDLELHMQARAPLEAFEELVQRHL